MGKGHGGLPDRWLDYIAIGKQITGIPIAACKVPLKEELVRNRISNHDERFTPDVLMRKVPNLGCVVDLTATYRYYDPSVFTRRGIRHEKIFCEGHVVPSPPTVRRFFQVVDEFLHSVQSRGKVLMVHCTHGLNRTGYLVSRYMVERRGYKPQDAIAAFNEARGHAIERDNYLEDLKKRNLLEGSEPQPAEDWWSQGAILAAIDVDQQEQPARAISRKETDEDRASNQPEFAGESRERPRHHRNNEYPQRHGRDQGQIRRDPDEDRPTSRDPINGASNKPDYDGESRERPRHNRNNYPPQRQWRNRGDPETRNYERDQQRSYDRDERPSSKNNDRDERPSSRNYERQFQPRQSFNYERDNRVAAPRNSWRNQSYNPPFNGQQQYNRSNQPPPHHLRFDDDASQVVRQGDERRDRSYRSETDERPSAQNSHRRRRH